MTEKRHFHKRPQKIDNYKPPFPDEILAEPVTNLTLREETSSLLLGASLTTIGDVLKRTETDFYKISKFNKKNLYDIKNAVNKRNLFLKPLPVNSEDEKKSAPEKRIEQNNTKQGKQNSNKQSTTIQNPQSGKVKISNKNQQSDKIQKKPEQRVNEKIKQAPYVMTTIPEKPPRPVKEVIKEESDRYVKINKGGLWGFRDRNGKDMAVPAVYDEVFSYKDELCCVQKDEKFGFINRQGEEIIPLIYDCATSFSEGLACVFKGDHCGYIDKKGETVIDFHFDAGTPVIGGECRVKKNGKWGELHISNPNEIRWII